MSLDLGIILGTPSSNTVHIMPLVADFIVLVVGLVLTNSVPRSRRVKTLVHSGRGARSYSTVLIDVSWWWYSVGRLASLLR